MARLGSDPIAGHQSDPAAFPASNLGVQSSRVCVGLSERIGSASVPLSPISRLSTAGAPTIVFGVSRGGVLGHVSVQVKLGATRRHRRLVLSVN
jgi:hypothetical protein